MKILIISDSHGYEQELAEIKERYANEVQLMIHCGDSELPSDHEALQGFSVVRGNCDFDVKFPNEVEHNVNGCKLFATHGHLFNVKMNVMSIGYRAEEVGAQIVCFGHSHLAGSEQINGRLFINPGSIRLPRGRKDATYCILDVYNQGAHVLFYNKNHEMLDDLSTKYSM
ncbi:metallophosphoesterase family protein [Bacillus pinisoli]|uniref:metallophosphoesterase family protein n=1 Tax=Bacillus pinisoli TaxID=2901866 RepID=UPI001FF46610|nr:metallophosphoesterase [Bacillus pinisoli]